MNFASFAKFGEGGQSVCQTVITISVNSNKSGLQKPPAKRCACGFGFTDYLN